jgi:hypothetical protein
MKKAASFNVLLGEGALQNRWRQNGASFIRIRKNKFRFNFVYIIAVALVVLIVYIILPADRHLTSYRHLHNNDINTPAIITNAIINYNANYPLTKPLVNAHQKSTSYRIGLIADLDTNSKRSKKDEYSSFYMTGWLTISSSHSSFEFKFDADTKELTSGYALKGSEVV